MEGQLHTKELCHRSRREADQLAAAKELDKCGAYCHSHSHLLVLLIK